MKKKQLKTKSRATVKVASTAAATPADNSQKSETPPAAPAVSIAAGVQHSFVDYSPPTPDQLLYLADEEVDRNLLEDYSDTVFKLRDEKGFSFREIASWLTDHGINADYNAVYRLYTKGMNPEEVHMVDKQEEDEARAEMH